MLKRPVLFVVRVFAIVAAGVALYAAWRNPERHALDASARSGVLGKFVGSSLGTTHYETTGPDTGRVVVLVHGFSVPQYIWDSTFTALRTAGIRTIRYDLFGRGLSDRPDVAYDGAMYDAQLDELLDSLHVSQPIDLVGLSFGGYVTAHYVAGHRARVNTLTLVDPVASAMTIPGVLATPVLGPLIWQTAQVPGMAEQQSSDFLHPEHFPVWADQYRPQMQYKGFGRALLRTALTLSHTNIDSLYGNAGRTGVPTLLVWGKQDQTVPIALSDIVRRNIPQAEYLPVDSAGHLPHIEQATLVHARLVAFLNAHPALQTGTASPSPTTR